MNRYLNVQFWQDFWQDALTTGASRGIRILIILLIYGVARQALYRLIDAALARLVARQQQQEKRESRDTNAPSKETQLQYEERANRLRTLQGLVKSLVGYVLFFVLILMLLQAISVDVTGLITTAGIGGVAIGFGAQKLVKDIISGFFIIVEDQYAVGDFVTIGTATGEVVEIGMRVTRLRDEQGRLWIISNGDVSVVTNHSRAPIEAFVEIGLAVGADVAKAQAIIEAVGKELKQTEGSHLLSAPKSLGVAGFDAAKTTLRVAVIADPRYLTAEQLRVREAIRERLVTESIPVG